VTNRLASGLRRVVGDEGFLLLGALAVLVVLGVSAWVAEDVVPDEVRAFDDAVLRLLRQPGDADRPIGPAWLFEVARDITALGSRSVILLVVLAVLGYLGLQRRWGQLWLVAIAAAGGGAVSTVLKELVGRPRPPLASPLAAAGSSSFPSGHAMLAAAVYLTLGVLLAGIARPRRVKVYVLAVASLLVVLVGLSRIYLGVHYPTDVLAGWVGGLAWALVCWLVARALQRRGLLRAAARGR
jgi:undecaprenyl-diphosphatase